MSPDPELPPPALPLAETVAPDQAAAAPTPAPPGDRSPAHSRCENCDTPLAGPYCHRCGQHDFDLHRSFRHVFLEALDTLFNLEGRFFRSILTLLFRPGRLTADFNAGKRIAQMPPFRLYIFVSFLFFLVIFLDRTDDQFIRQTDKPHQGLTLNGQPVTMASPGGPPRDAAPPATAAPAPPEKMRLVDQVRTTAEEARARAEERAGGRESQSAWANQINEQGRLLNDPAYRQRLSERIQASLPHMLMLCLPLFALYTRVLFRQSGLLYLQHLVLALHFHTFIFLWVLFCQGWAALADLPGWGLRGWFTGLCSFWLWVYPVLMLRRLFTNSWPLTVVKTLLLAFGYTLTLGLGFMVLAAALFLVA